MILHGSRSGLIRSTHAEFNSTANYGQTTQLAFNVTIGEDIYALHLTVDKWGWNARGCSGLYLAAEFAQPTLDYSIGDAMVRAFVIWFRDVARKQYPNIPAVFPTHSELDGTDDYGTYDGKSDVFEKDSMRTEDLRNRIYAHLDYWNIRR